MQELNKRIVAIERKTRASETEITLQKNRILLLETKCQIVFENKEDFAAAVYPLIEAKLIEAKADVRDSFGRRRKIFFQNLPLDSTRNNKQLV